ncbi:MAG: NADH-quinone oxidoreductase subunit L [Planctomycetes bacterium]|nr:NADH-quinone oxidoreductase subunit L [Planctomycetota bacterium]MBI3834648.1 NADH-quinone oxidoreductase subunit L [Planctomycetota bacterium]
MNGHSYELALAAGVLSPLFSFWALVFLGPRMGKPIAGWFGVILGMGVPLAMAAYVLLGWLGLDAAARAQLTVNAIRLHWAYLGSVPVTIGVKLDSLTVAMFFMVTFIAFWIFFFSVGYMAGHSDEVDHQSKYHRFFAYLSLFGFSMLGLVVSSSLLFLFIFWELVGLCSYLLIGFYFDRQYATRAAMKAFITNRVGDFGFIIGLMLVYFHLHTLDLDEAARNFAAQHASGTGIFANTFALFGFALPTLMGIGLFCGAMGKSAQFPLHVWLPDAMAGPTPVSALIHAATMVAAGVYLVARVFRLMTPDALMFISTIGCLTLFLMALIAIVQTDIKKCLAYSTLSQLGYMIFGLGCGAWIAALFHLITHAFFKAMLFLGSGQVIEGCHHEQDMRKMGGLIKKMPVTGITFLIGVLAIAGFGIPGTSIGLGGFFSKDEILAVAYARAFQWDDVKKFESSHERGGEEHHSTENTPQQNGELNDPKSKVRMAKIESGEQFRLVSDEPPHKAAAASPETTEPEHSAHRMASIFAGTKPLPSWMFWLAIATAYITPFYMMRAWWMTFMGKPRDEHVHHHAHESSLMFIPLIVLAGGTLVSSYFLFRPLIADASAVASAAPMVLATDGAVHTQAISAAHHWLEYGVGFAFAIGFIFAIAIYARGLEIARRIQNLFFVWPVHALLVHKYYIDEIYDLVWVKGCLLVANICRFFDTWIVDLVFDTLAAGTERLAAFSGLVLDNHGVDGVVNGVASTSMDVSDVLRGPQTGRIRNYVLFAAGAATMIIVLLLWVGVRSATAVTP